MRAIIIDDEQAMLFVMERHLSQIEGVTVVGAFRQGSEALAYIQRESADLAFIDMNIAGEHGLTLARTLRTHCPALEIVFVTSHKEFALDAFDVYPLDYIVKPISGLRLAETIDRAKRHAGARPVPAAGDTGIRLNVRCLGSFEADDPQNGKVKWISRKSQEIFAYLLMHRGRSVSKSRMLEDIFPEMSLHNAHNYMNTAIYQLRKVLSEHGMKSAVLSGNEQYHLDMSRIDADFIQFEEQASRMREWEESNLPTVTDLVESYGGDLFGDWSYSWSIAERERISAIYENLAERLIQWLETRQNLREASRIARKLAMRYEWEED